MRFSIKKALVAAVLSAATLSAAAHHSTNNIDLNKTVEIKGILKQVEFINPHTQYYLDAKDASGKITAWRFESHPPGWFRKAGIKRSDLESGVGKEVTISANPAKDGSSFGYLKKVTFPDGHSIGFGP